ncbi:MAG: hypothetical protein AAF499_04315 [Pseudomonadota bacterium]
MDKCNLRIHDASAQAYGIVELYLELLKVRVLQLQKVKDLPGDMQEACSSLMYASTRMMDVTELTTVRCVHGFNPRGFNPSTGVYYNVLWTPTAWLGGYGAFQGAVRVLLFCPFTGA